MPTMMYYRPNEHSISWTVGGVITCDKHLFGFKGFAKQFPLRARAPCFLGHHVRQHSPVSPLRKSLFGRPLQLREGPDCL